jgi:hypothetical protein
MLTPEMRPGNLTIGPFGGNLVGGLAEQLGVIVGQPGEQHHRTPAFFAPESASVPDGSGKKVLDLDPAAKMAAASSSRFSFGREGNEHASGKET